MKSITYLTEPKPPLNLRASDQTATTLTVTWEAPDCEYSHFLVQIEDTANKEHVMVEKGSTLKAEFCNLTPGVAYTITAKTRNGDLESEAAYVTLLTGKHTLHISRL